MGSASLGAVPGYGELRHGVPSDYGNGVQPVGDNIYDFLDLLLRDMFSDDSRLVGRDDGRSGGSPPCAASPAAQPRHTSLFRCRGITRHSFAGSSHDSNKVAGRNCRQEPDRLQ